MSERARPGGNYFQDDPSVLDTKIELAGSATVENLAEVLKEYRRQNADLAQEPLDWQVARFGPSRYQPVFKELILAAFLDAAVQPDRDLTRHPVLIPEVALRIMDETGMFLAQSVTTPFVFNPDTGTFGPDFLTLQIDATDADVEFSQAYADVKNLVAGVLSADNS